MRSDASHLSVVQKIESKDRYILTSFRMHLLDAEDLDRTSDRVSDTGFGHKEFILGVR